MNKPSDPPAPQEAAYAAMVARMEVMERELQQLAYANAIQNVLQQGLDDISVKLEPLRELTDLRSLSPQRAPLEPGAAQMLKAIRAALARPPFTQTRLPLIGSATPRNSLGSTTS